MNERLTRHDRIFIAVCAAVAIVCIAIVYTWFGSAFPEAAIDFRYDRAGSRPLAEAVLRGQRLETAGMKHTAVLDSDSDARIFLERSLGLEKAVASMRRDVHVWYWHHRWFRPLQEEEYRVDIAPTGELVTFVRTIPEDRAIPAAAAPLAVAEAFLRRANVDVGDLQLVARSDRRLPARLQQIYTWDSKSVRPAGAPYRYTVTVDGDAVSSFSRRIEVPEEWLRSYRQLRSKNAAAGNVDGIFMIITIVAALVVFVVRLRRGDIHMRFVLTVGAIAVVLVAGVAANSLPIALAGYDTTTSYAAFLTQFGVFSALQGIGTAMMLIVVCGAGEVLYRERLPRQLAIPRLWNRRALASRRVFFSLILGYTLVAFFIAYQVAFYLIASKFGAWSPADVPYDDMLNTAFPWIAVLFAGFFPAFSEEFLSRAFSIPFFQRVLRSRIAAIVIAGFIWGFGHATYPNQPFYIRGLEVGIAGVLIGLLMDRYGLLALLVWHYTVDAVYTSLLLFRSGNTYYVTSATLCSLVFAVPLVVAIVLYIRNRGFVPDEDLTNAALPTNVQPPEEKVEEPRAELPPSARAPRWRIALLLALIAAGIAAAAFYPEQLDDVVEYRTTRGDAKSAARDHLLELRQPARVHDAAMPVSGFRSWERESPREEGGAPGGFDSVAAEHAIRSGLPVGALADVMRTKIPAATWMVRFFTPSEKREYFVEVDGRTGRVVGYHKYEDERAPGPRLEQGDALTIARTAFSRYGVDAAAFDLEEALSFQQPDRRDWLFHFDERTPIVDHARRRISVRVMGSEVTQFAPTIRVPDSVYREASTQTLLQTVLLIAKVIGIVLALAFVITGIILATRHGGFALGKVLRPALLLSLIPIFGAFVGREEELFGYSTTVAWDTFTLNRMTGYIRDVGIQIALIFVGLAAMRALYPWIGEVLRRPGRRRFGGAAVVSAVAAVAAIVALRGLLQHLALTWPAAARVDEIAVPAWVAVPMPALVALSQAVIGAVFFSAAAATFIAGISGIERPWLRHGLAIATIFCASLDPTGSTQQIALMLISAALTAIVLWALARFVLADNPLAWPLAAFIAASASAAWSMLRNGRQDLVVQGIVVLFVAGVVIAWTAATRRETSSAISSGFEK